MSFNDPTHQLETELCRLQDANFSYHNTDVLTAFVNQLAAEDLSAARQIRYMQSFRRMQDLIDFRLDDADPGQIHQLVAAVNRGETHEKAIKPWTKAEYRKAVKKLYTSLGEKDMVEFISTKPKKHERPKTDPDELLEKHHVHRLIDGATNTRDAALIFALWETGARIKEFLSMQWSDVTTDTDVTRIRIRNSKTGQRTVPVIASTPHLQAIQQDDGPVWRKQTGDRMPYSTVRSIIQRARRHADIPDHKKTNPHAFRKSRATYLASQGMNEANLCKLFGWAEGSRQPAVYIRLADTDVENAVRSIHSDKHDAVQTTLTVNG